MEDDEVEFDSEPFDQDIEPFILNDSKFSSSTILAGHAFRIAEELYTEKNTIKISENYINGLINKYKKNSCKRRK